MVVEHTHGILGSPACLSSLAANVPRYVFGQASLVIHVWKNSKVCVCVLGVYVLAFSDGGDE